MKIRTFISTGALALSSLVSACALVPGLQVDLDNDPVEVGAAYEVIAVTPQVVMRQKEAALARASSEEFIAADPSAPPPAYLIGPGDVLQVVVWDHIELTNPFGGVSRDPVSGGQLVATDGTIFFPYAGVLSVGGKTVQEVRAELTVKLASVVMKPQVDVRVVAYRSGRVQVTGEVKNPGVVTMDDTAKGVLEAINERGGLNPTASRRTALLIRAGKRYEIDIAGLLSGERPTTNPALRPGDVVHVPDTGSDQVFVLGEVARQGALVIGQQQMSLTEALTKSGGLERLAANDSGVLIFRKPVLASDPAQIFAFDLSAPTGMLLAGEFNLSSRDVIYVKTTKFSQYNRVINQFLPTITTIYQLDRLTPILE